MAPFEQLVGVLRILPLNSTENDPVPTFRRYPPYGKWSWTSVDELFYHILMERQKPNSSLSSASSASMLSQELDLSEDAEWNRVRLDSREATTITKEYSRRSPSPPSSEEEDSEEEEIVDARAGGEKVDGDKAHHKHHRIHHRHHHHHHHHHHDHSSDKHRSKNREKSRTPEVAGTGESDSPTATTTTTTTETSKPGSSQQSVSASTLTSRQRREFGNVGRLPMKGIPRGGRFKDSRNVHRGRDTRSKYDRDTHSV